ncbi:hypothetical protein [Helicobacter aurati]|nr:hypothetical protein [Helicobacter aurati]
MLFAQGSEAIDAGRTTNGDVQGSRGIANNDNFADRFNIATNTICVKLYLNFH